MTVSDQEPSTENPAEDDNKTFEEIMKMPTSLPEDLVFTMTNFADEQDAQKCADVLRGYMGVFGRWMDLSRLDRVYISFDYAGTLASLDLGTGSDTILQPTRDDVATGVAMAPSVLRDDGWKTVIVMDAGYARSLSYEMDGTEENVPPEKLDALRAETLHILAHECGHVHDHAMQRKSLSADTYGKKWSALELRIKEPAMACWSEYIAEFMGGGFGTESTLSNYENTFCDRLETAWPAITAAIRQYRMHGDIERVLSEVGFHIRKVIIYAAYLFGYLSNVKREFEEAAPKATQALSDCPELGSYVTRVRDELHTLHDVYPDFTSLEVFTQLATVIYEMYQRAGLTFIENTDGTLRVDIPYRADTLPSLEQQLEYLSETHGA